MKVRAAVLRAFRQTYVEQRCLEVTPPLHGTNPSRRRCHTFQIRLQWSRRLHCTILATLPRNLLALPRRRLLRCDLIPC
jgi:hypothetical protein